MSRFEELAEEFARIANDPRGQFQSFLDSAKKVVGCVPEFTPEELVHAMGMAPFGMWGADAKVTRARTYFPTFYCGIVQTVLDLALMKKYKGMSAVIIPTLCDTLKALTQNWQHGVDGVPYIPMTYPQNRKPAYGQQFTKEGYERVIRDLERCTGAEFSDEALGKTIEVYNEHSHLMRQFSVAAASHDCVTPTIRRNVFKSAWFMLKEDHSKLVREMVRELSAMEVETKKTRIVTSGILVDNLNLLKILEENSMTIVGDDVVAESGQYRTDAPASGPSNLDRLVAKFTNTGDVSMLLDPERHREVALADLAKERRADGVLIVLTKFCDPEEFDLPRLRKAVMDAGLKEVTIEVDRQMDRFDQAQTALETFHDVLAYA